MHGLLRELVPLREYGEGFAKQASLLLLEVGWQLGEQTTLSVVIELADLLVYCGDMRDTNVDTN
jgi:hypothetical protein